MHFSDYSAWATYNTLTTQPRGTFRNPASDQGFASTRWGSPPAIPAATFRAIGTPMENSESLHDL